MSTITVSPVTEGLCCGNRSIFLRGFPGNWKLFSDYSGPGYHTTVDVRRVFGGPDLDLNGFPQQGWYYGPLPDGSDLFFHFDLGLLSSIGLEPSAVTRYRAEH